MKKTILAILVLLLAVGFILAANKFPATLTVKNQTDGNIIISMEYPYSFLVVEPGTTGKFTIARDDYSGVVTACGKTKSVKMDMNHNLKLNFTPCAAWTDTGAKKYLGEPTQEKPNWNRSPNSSGWRFEY